MLADALEDELRELLSAPMSTVVAIGVAAPRRTATVDVWAGDPPAPASRHVMDLSVRDAQTRPGDHVDRWDLPAQDLASLRQWGLPDGPMCTPDLQSGDTPELVPNVASDVERSLVAPTQRLYQLGWWGSRGRGNPRVGVVAGGGPVLEPSERPVRGADLPRGLREHYGDQYYSPAVRFFNSSLTAFVEVAWRWRAFVAVLHRGEGPDTPSKGDPRLALRREFIAAMTDVDPAIEGSLWMHDVLER